jgi:3-dehydroquinate synthase
MKKISVVAEHAYDVEIGVLWKTALEYVASKHSHLFVIIPVALEERLGLKKIYANQSGLTIRVVPDGEEQKDHKVVTTLWDEIAGAKISRTDAVVGIGGGASTDLAGFVAATWLRGVNWYAIPTTLAGMVDASVGGKTGINTAAGKNLVGAFHSPSGVYIDTSFLDTLSDRDFAAGLAEVIKTGFIRDVEILNLLEKHPTIEEARTVAEELIWRSVQVKAEVVSADFKESKLREILNYGHTFGHAVEKLAHYSLRHGEAVAIGMHYEALLSAEAFGLSKDVIERQKGLLKSFGLLVGIDPKSFPFKSLLGLMAGDKKSRNGELRFVGLTALGEPGWIQAPNESILRAVYEKIAL